MNQSINKPKWKRFEEVVYKIQKSFAGDAEIKLDDNVNGYDSKTTRQVDIGIKKNVAQYPIFIAIECKDIKTPLDVNEVESFCSKIKDIRASRGVIVSSSGFTKAALEVAKTNAIATYRLVDTASIDWKAFASIPALLVRTFPGRYRIKLKDFSSIPNVVIVNFALLKVFNERGEYLGTIRDVVNKNWNEKRDLPGPGYEEITIGENYYIEVNHQKIKTTIVCTLEIRKEYHFGYMPVDLQGFKDEQTGKVITREIASEYFSPHEIETGKKGWVIIDDPDKLPVHPVMVLSYSDVYNADSNSVA